KTNPSLYKGILTGITKVSKESIFSGLNNLTVDTIFDEQFSQYFGITEPELKEMLAFYSIPEKYAEMKEWYDGYDFGGLEIYNPWSVIQYIYKNCQADAYWVNTSGNSLIGEALQSLDEKDRESLPSLLTGGEVEKQIDTNLIYSEIYSDESAAFCDKQTHVKVDSN
ncbi:MAG: AAA family ATPase, partial [Elusimicrobiales bacterium]|nr:AAA family ATPase [Elusimicrobiales bacterium]